MLFYCVPVIDTMTESMTESTYRKVRALCKDMRGSRSSLYSAITMKIVVSWRLKLASPDSAELKAYALSV